MSPLTPAVIDPLADRRWSAFVERAPGATVFHHPAWLGLLRAEYRYPLAACALVRADGALAAGLPVAKVSSRLTGRRLVAMPFSDQCPPLVDADGAPEAPSALADALDALRRRERLPLEVRGTGDVLADAFAGARYHHHVLALEPDVARVERRFRKSQVGRGVRRALREGLHAERRTDAAALDAFYRLHLATRRRLGVPTQPRGFIRRFAQLFADGLGFVLLVRRGDAVVAGAVFLTFRNVLTYKYGASDARFLSARPNNLLFMEAIRWGCEHGMSWLDFGRTDWGQESLRAFKLAWGADERELRYRHLADTPPQGGGGAAERWLGAGIRRSPAIAGRLVGELLYRHAG